MKQTKIVVTIGSSTDSVSQIKKLYENGMDVVRLNFSHANHEYFAKVIKNIRKVSNEIAIMLDTKGPEIRTGEMKEDIELKNGDTIVLTKKKIIGTKEKITINYSKLEKLKIGDFILIDDGNIECRVIKKIKDEILVKINNEGILSSHKNVLLRGHNVEIKFLSKKDKEDIDFAIKNNLDFIALSFVRNEKDVNEIKNYLNKKNSSEIKIISKIEHWEALNNLNKIIEVSDAIMVARGDLAVEIPMEQVPKYQKKIIKYCNELGKPVIVATQMLESMRNNPRPTRAEVSDITQAILEGSDAIMLSGETTIGKYPIESVKMMTKIANEYDKEVNNTFLNDKLTEKEISKNSISMFVTKATYIATKELNISAIITPTKSGFTSRNVSRFKPKCPIIAITDKEIILRQLQLSWGVFPFLDKKKYSTVDEMIYQNIIFAYKKNLIKKEDKIVITSGHSVSESRLTNSFEIYKVKEILKKIL